MCRMWLDDQTDAPDARPHNHPIDPTTGRRLPLDAFAVLTSGDVFESSGGPPPIDAVAAASQYLTNQVQLRNHGAKATWTDAVSEKIHQQLRGNAQLIARLNSARPVVVDIIPRGKRMADYGYPPRASAQAVGLFWNHPSWQTAKIALLETALEQERGVVIHEMAHAIWHLALTEAEQQLVYRLLLPTYRSHAWVDEVFAIYSEREFVPYFTEREGHAPGVYGLARRRWDDRHAFTRFVRLLYHPHMPLERTRRPTP